MRRRSYILHPVRHILHPTSYTSYVLRPTCSQYPHEKEVLLPPLTGLEAIGNSVAGKLLCIDSRLSLNLAAQTLEQVLRDVPRLH